MRQLERLKRKQEAAAGITIALMGEVAADFAVLHHVKW